jgi:hypothetical protein
MKPMKRTLPTKSQFTDQAAKAAASGQDSWVWTSPSTKREYRFTLKQKHSTKIKSELRKSLLNYRGSKHLVGMACVIDIFSEIQRDGKNNHPGIVVGSDDGVGEILAGFRRSHAVSLCDDAYFVYWYCESMDYADQDQLADTSDKHEKPSVADRVVSLQEIENAYGSELEDNKLAEKWGVTERYIREVRRFQRAIPERLYGLFPALRYIPYTLLQDLAKKYDRERIEAVLDQVTPASHNINDDDEAKAESQRVRSEILGALVPKRAKRTLPQAWDIETKEGVTVKPGNKGAVTISVKAGALSEDQEEAIRQILLG